MPPIRTPNSAETPAGSAPSKAKWNQKNLRIELGLDEETMKNVLNTMKEQIQLLFDTNTLLSAQHEELRQLDLVLLKTYPEIFTDESDNKLKWLRIYVHKRHGQARFHQKRRESGIKTEDCDQSTLLSTSGALSRASSPACPLDPNPIDLTHEAGMDDEGTPNSTISGPSVNPPPRSSPAPSSWSQLTSLPSSPRDSAMVSLQPSSPAPSATSTALHSTPCSSRSLFSFGTTLRATPSPPSASLLSRTAATAGATSLVEYFSGSNIREVEGLRYFLKKFCDPPMESFLDRFLQYGCHSLGWLRPVRTWPVEVIDSFLRNLPKTNGRDMTPMEVIVLRMCILTFPFDNKDTPHVQIQSC
ncbi:hypothetical protein BKA70DRAFT_228200 [Coprinopsis sp. MPI-PUGE-AT-0042]|nr:hypothetical protein BKA70DRAFT_228200 [Coprinopsis sp. MPI-PUGE-AT-0042]